MLQYDDSDEALMAFYDLKNINPTSVRHLNLKLVDNIDSEEIDKLRTDEQFNLLSSLVNHGYTGGTHSEGGNPQQIHEDYEDPLRGKGTDIAKQLIESGVATSRDDPKIQQYLISSKIFDSNKFLTTIHKDTSINDLEYSLRFLESNINSQTGQLKSVIDENYVNFINCKKSFDDILTDFKNLKSDAQLKRENTKVFNPQRNSNRRAQESLLTDLEEGLNSLNLTKNLMIRPVIEQTHKEQKISRLIDFIKSHSFFFDLPNKLIASISERDHDTFIEDYSRYLKEKEDLLSYQKSKYELEAERLRETKDNTALKQLEQDQFLINTALSKVFMEVENIITEYRRKIHNELLTMDHLISREKNTKGSGSSAKFLSLVSKLYQLNANEYRGKTANPVEDFLDAQLGGVQKDLDYHVNKFDNRFTMMQRKIFDYINSFNEKRLDGSYMRYLGEKYFHFEDFLKASSTVSKSRNGVDELILEVFDSEDNIDLSIINETWLVLHNFGEYLSEVFVLNLEKFVQNYAHYANPDNGFNVDPQGIVRDKFFRMFELITSFLVSLFSDDSEDVKQLESSPRNYTQFLPYYTNSLSACFYLTKIGDNLNNFVTKMGEFVATVGNATNANITNKGIENLRSASSKINQKIVEAVCAVWVNDCSQFYDLESWDIKSEDVSSEKVSASYTRIVKMFEAYETYILQKISYLVFKKESRSPIRIVSSYPSKRMLVSLEIQFIRSLNIFIDSIMKAYNIEASKGPNPDGFEIYKILTMNNLDVIERKTYPRLIFKFDRLFDKQLSKQNLKLFEDIDKVNIGVFRDIMNGEVEWIGLKLQKLFNKIPSTPIKNELLKVDGIVYEILIHFVKFVHTVKPLTSLEIFAEILNQLQDAFIKDFLAHTRNLMTLLFDPKWLSRLKFDLNFFLEVFEPSKYLKLKDSSLKPLHLTMKLIEENERPDYTNANFEYTLDQDLRNSENVFDCFIR